MILVDFVHSLVQTQPLSFGQWTTIGFFNTNSNTQTLNISDQNASTINISTHHCFDVEILKFFQQQTNIMQIIGTRLIAVLPQQFVQRRHYGKSVTNGIVCDINTIGDQYYYFNNMFL